MQFNIADNFYSNFLQAISLFGDQQGHWLFVKLITISNTMNKLSSILVLYTSSAVDHIRVVSDPDPASNIMDRIRILLLE